MTFLLARSCDMKQVLRMAYFCCMAALPGLAGSWSGSGWLVDSKCYANMLSNRSEPDSYVNWDISFALRYCSPNYRTKAFAIVQEDQAFIKLNPGGNQRVIELLMNDRRKALYFCNIRGSLFKHVVTVEDISITRPPARLSGQLH